MNFNQNENKDISCVKYLGNNSLYGLARSMELSVDIFGWDEISKFIENFFKKYKNSDIGHFWIKPLISWAIKEVPLILIEKMTEGN